MRDWEFYDDGGHAVRLSLKTFTHPELAGLLARNGFEMEDSVGIHVFTLLVPLAWAVGSISRQALMSLPFTLMETLSAVEYIRCGKQQRLPLAGYEADNDWRARLLAISNRLNWGWAKRSRRAVRIGLHPFDLQHLLADHIVRDLNRVTQFCDYADLQTAACM